MMTMIDEKFLRLRSPIREIKTYPLKINVAVAISYGNDEVYGYSRHIPAVFDYNYRYIARNFCWIIPKSYFLASYMIAE